jgi:hypothetical protein
VARLPGDLQVFESLPVEVFRFAWEQQPDVFQGALEEYQWFQQQRGLIFPPPPVAIDASPWGPSTRQALGSILSGIDSNQLREFLTGYLKARG